MSDDALQDILDQLEAFPMRKHATELGMISILWSRLELQLDILLLGLMQLREPEAASIILGSMDLKNKISAILALGFVRKPNDRWYSDLKKLLDEINTDLRNKRNRYMHDYWLGSEDKVFRLSMAPKVKRPQSREFAIEYHKAEETAIGTLKAFQIQLLAAAGKIMSLISEAKLPYELNEPASDPPEAK